MLGAAFSSPCRSRDSFSSRPVLPLFFFFFLWFDQGCEFFEVVPFFFRGTRYCVPSEVLFFFSLNMAPPFGWLVNGLLPSLFFGFFERAGFHPLPPLCASVPSSWMSTFRANLGPRFLLSSKSVLFSLRPGSPSLVVPGPTHRFLRA